MTTETTQGLYNERGQRICGALKHKSGERCKQWQGLGANGRCKTHGGRAAIGKAHPSFKTGRYSKHLPSKLLMQYQASLTDKDLLGLRDEIALVDSRIAELLTRMGVGERPEAWKQLKLLVSAAKSYNSRQNHDQTEKLLDSILNVIAARERDYAMWATVGEELDRRQRLVDSEHKKKITSTQMVSATQVIVLLGVVQDVVARNVTDPTARRRVALELNRLVSGESSRVVEPEGGGA